MNQSFPKILLPFPKPLPPSNRKPAATTSAILSASTLVCFLAFATSASSQQPHGGRLDSLHEFNVSLDEGVDPPLILPCGDVNGDSIGELLVARPYDNTGGFEEGGSVELISGATLAPLHRWYGSQVEGSFGEAMAVLTDINGDGVNDIAIGSPNYSSAGMFENGAVFVYSGAAPYGFIAEWIGLADYSVFGSSIADVADMDSDGTSELLIGAPGEQNSFSENDAGAVYVFAGGLAQPIGTYFFWEGSFSGAHFGETVATPADFDGDGARDFIVSAPGEESVIFNYWNDGEVVIFSSQNGAVIHSFEGDGLNDRFGITLASAGDLDFDGDGTPDLLVGAPFASPFAEKYDVGQVYLYSGATGEEIFFWIGEHKFDWFGYSLDTGDVTGDGKADILVGAPLFESGNINNRGGFYVFDGVTAERVMFKMGETTNSVLGARMNFLGDRNGDGNGDFSASRFEWVSGFLPEGRAEIYSGKINPQMSANGNSISNASGGSIQFTLDFPDEAGLYWYQMLFSAAGTGPVDIQGLPVPLGYDSFLVESYMGVYDYAFDAASGLLNGGGNKTCKLNIPAGGIPPSLIDTTLYFAAISKAVWGDWEYSSVALPVTLLP